MSAGARSVISRRVVLFILGQGFQGLTPGWSANLPLQYGRGTPQFAIVQSWRDGNRQVVVERAADIVKPHAWVQDGRRVIRSSGLDDEDLRAGGGQFGGKNRTGRACSHHDEVVVTLDFFIRCVDHCWISRCLIKPNSTVAKIFAKGLI